MATYCESTVTKTGTEYFDFDVVDSRNRRLGAAVVRFTRTWTEVPANELNVVNGQFGTFATRVGSGWVLTEREPGVDYGYAPQAMRDGKKFGAFAQSSVFQTEQERDAGVAKYLAGARKRAQQKTNR